MKCPRPKLQVIRQCYATQEMNILELYLRTLVIKKYYMRGENSNG